MSGNPYDENGHACACRSAAVINVTGVAIHRLAN